VMPHGAARGVGGVAKDRLQQHPTRGENRHCPRPPVGRSLGCNSGRCISHGQIPVAEGLHVERDEVALTNRVGGCNCARRGKGAVEDVDTAGSRSVGSVQLGLSLVDR
jgi:hypothetical protein